ncbi:MAG: hypothetical protein KBH93_08180 [Anaerolineae bacterium]|nr:hypothetical protein [Anaerolineae bacterium]
MTKGVRLMQGEQVLASAAGITLTNLNLRFDYVPSLLRQLLFTRFARHSGLAPVEHVSSISVVRRRIPGGFLVFLVLLVVGLAVGNNDKWLLWGFAIAEVLVWWFWVENIIVVTVNGSPFVSAAVHGELDEIHRLIEAYAALKAQYLGIHQSRSASAP